MPRWKIPVTWEGCGFVKIDADRLEDAMDYVKNHGDHIKLYGRMQDGSAQNLSKASNSE